MGDAEGFLGLSVALTGYDRASLWSTGCVPAYRKQLDAVAGPALADRLDHIGGMLGALPPGPAVDALIREEVLSDADLGPLARSLIQLWYLGQWTPMPQDWIDRNGAKREDTARIVSTRAYREGLVWDAIGAHPMGAKPQGFGAWAEEPPSETVR
ncbi:hypothetical protein G5B40_13055 [Pikeienuella piscinae]|uniref:Sorbitol dehydrogenase n=1 Tax=Pikeienuella piscinae TaxID=2748098 RepID=A0A7L5C366_9RHOB|nr:hypothetical protein [Pikeienuella piscinae]QIE56309.1 hypothetical protein G5B40_13055 [Pikeienuella piscinae]